MLRDRTITAVISEEIDDNLRAALLKKFGRKRGILKQGIMDAYKLYTDVLNGKVTIANPEQYGIVEPDENDRRFTPMSTEELVELSKSEPKTPTQKEKDVSHNDGDLQIDIDIHDDKIETDNQNKKALEEKIIIQEPEIIKPTIHHIIEDTPKKALEEIPITKQTCQHMPDEVCQLCSNLTEEETSDLKDVLEEVHKDEIINNDKKALEEKISQDPIEDLSKYDNLEYPELEKILLGIGDVTPPEKRKKYDYICNIMARLIEEANAKLADSQSQ